MGKCSHDRIIFMSFQEGAIGLGIFIAGICLNCNEYISGQFVTGDPLEWEIWTSYKAWINNIKSGIGYEWEVISGEQALAKLKNWQYAEDLRSLIYEE